MTPTTASQALDRLSGCYGDGRFGILSEHTAQVVAAGLLVTQDGRWAFAPGTPARRFLCSELVQVATEDGPIVGRCGEPTVTAWGTCAAHDLGDPEADCVHGMSASLCAGPNHYPTER